jgi:lipid II:glycine glycyltransferase (peptidoglycan interpeptide bridge formation enzyme)
VGSDALGTREGLHRLIHVGRTDELSESDPMWGVYRFKQGFGGQFVQHIGAWDSAASRPLYWLYTTAMPRLFDLMRRQHWKQRLAPEA